MSSLDNTTVILVRPQIAANIGFVARACKACGWDSVNLVHSQPHEILSSEAYRTASGAQEILDNFPCFSDLNHAVESQHQVVGFSRRKHEFERPTLSLRDWSECQKDTNQRVALVFGPEDFGLSNEEKHVCDLIVRIPTAIDTLSLNLSHAITVVLYELFQQSFQQKKEPLNQDQTFATHAERERLLKTLVAMLENSRYFKEGRKTYQIEIIRNLLGKMHLQQQEYHTLMGVLKALDKAKPDK